MNSRKAFTMIEVIFAIAISSIFILGFLKLQKGSREDKADNQERLFNQVLNSGIQESFISITEAYSTISSTFADADNDWGWNAVGARNTSPLPISTTVGGIGRLDFRLDNTRITAASLASLRTNIVSNFRGACTEDLAAQPNGNLRLVCPQLSSLSYTTTLGANLPSVHTLTQPLDSLNVPTVSVFFWREFPTGNLPKVIREYRFSMNETYLSRRNFSTRKLNTIRSAMEGFSYRTIIREVANSPTSGGLHSSDDEFVPWYWKMFGDNNGADVVNNSICAKGAGITCVNFNSNTIWRTAVAGRGLYSNRMVSNLLGGDLSFTIDGFNNPIFILPHLGACPIATTNLNACPVVPPPLPSDNYLNIGNPPFVSVVYTPTFTNKSVIAPSYGRIYVSY